MNTSMRQRTLDFNDQNQSSGKVMGINEGSERKEVKIIINQTRENEDSMEEGEFGDNG